MDYFLTHWAPSAFSAIQSTSSLNPALNQPQRLGGATCNRGLSFDLAAAWAPEAISPTCPLASPGYIWDSVCEESEQYSIWFGIVSFSLRWLKAENSTGSRGKSTPLQEQSRCQRKARPAVGASAWRFLIWEQGNGMKAAPSSTSPRPNKGFYLEIPEIHGRGVLSQKSFCFTILVQDKRIRNFLGSLCIMFWD